MLKLQRGSCKTTVTLFDETLSNGIDLLGFQRCVHFVEKCNQEMHAKNTADATEIGSVGSRSLDSFERKGENERKSMNTLHM